MDESEVTTLPMAVYYHQMPRDDPIYERALDVCYVVDGYSLDNVQYPEIGIGIFSIEYSILMKGKSIVPWETREGTFEVLEGVSLIHCFSLYLHVGILF